MRRSNRVWVVMLNDTPRLVVTGKRERAGTRLSLLEKKGFGVFVRNKEDELMREYRRQYKWYMVDVEIA